MMPHPLTIEIAIAVCVLTPTAIPRLYRATRRAVRRLRAQVERVRFHRKTDRTWRAEERAQRAQDRAAATRAAASRLVAAHLTVPDTDPRYREIMRRYYASLILAPMPSNDPYGALLAARALVAQQWRDALDTTPEGGAA